MEIRELSKMRVASFVVISRYPEIQAVDYLDRWAKKQRTPPLPGERRFGFDYPVSEEQKKVGFRGYEYWINIPDDWTESEEIVIKVIAADTYAVMRITEPFIDPFESIPVGWKKLRDWVRNNKYHTDWSRKRYCLEEVIEKDGKCWMDIYFPVDRQHSGK